MFIQTFCHTVGFIPIIRLLEPGGYFPADLKKWLHIPSSIFSLCNKQHNKITTQITVILLRVGLHRGKNNNERGGITKQALNWKPRRERQQAGKKKIMKSFFLFFRKIRKIIREILEDERKKRKTQWRKWPEEEPPERRTGWRSHITHHSVPKSWTGGGGAFHLAN